MLRATKVRLYPTPAQEEFLRGQFGAVRFVYNKALYLKSRAYKRQGLSLNPLKDLKPLLAIAKRSRKYAWLKAYDSIALQQAVIHLDQAYKRFFDKKSPARHPRFKRRHGPQGSYHCTSVSVQDGSIRIPKIGSIPAKVHRPIPGKVRSITLTRCAVGKFYASILVEDGLAAPVAPASLQAHQTVGVDVGLTHFAVTSQGVKVANPRPFQAAQRNLKRKQQALARKQKGSRNRAKARLVVAKCHAHVANVRHDFQHKLSRTLIDENQAVMVETLKIGNMLKNRRLARHIADAGWAGFIAKLEYKAESAGKHLVKMDQWFASSKTCSVCASKEKDMPLNRRNWQCRSCDTLHDRDINAARNLQAQGILKLKAAGLVVSAHGGLHQPGTPPAAACEVRSLTRKGGE